MGLIDSVLRASVPGQPDQLAALDDAIRAPLPLSTPVGLVGATSDAPAALVGGLLAATLAARRPHRVLAVSTGRQQRGLAWHAGVTTAAVPTADGVSRRASAATGEEATDGLAEGRAGLWAIDLGSDHEAWWSAVAPIGRFFDFVVTDWGTSDVAEPLRATSAVIVIVTTARLDALQRAVDLRAHLAAPSVSPLVVVHGAAEANQHGLREAARVNDALWLPDDRGFAREEPPRGRALRYATNQAVLRLAAAVVSAASSHSLGEVTS